MKNTDRSGLHTKLFNYENQEEELFSLESQVVHPVRPKTGFGRPLICFSHLRWKFVFQRPQHLLTRFAKHDDVYFIEEPIFRKSSIPQLFVERCETGVTVLTPVINEGTSEQNVSLIVRRLVESELYTYFETGSAIFWYYTPYALSYSASWKSAMVVYDCMDELSAFAGAHPEMVAFEKDLFRRANVVFTGGRTLFEAKRWHHSNVHAMPSSIDKAHFGLARNPSVEPADQRCIAGPKIGFFGVIDERLDRELVAAVAAARPDWQFVFLGPVVKIDVAILPQLPNVHFLGQKQYVDLPNYLGYWDVAILPFALNDSTKFISPTKTPEYLAGGRPVVSTPIKDVEDPYGKLGLVQIARGPQDFILKIQAAMNQGTDTAWHERVDKFLSNFSWDKTWTDMKHLMEEGLRKNSSEAKIAAHLTKASASSAY